MTPESITFIVVAFWLLAAATLLLLGGWLIRYDLSRNGNAHTSRITQDLRPFQDLVVQFFAHTEPSTRLLSVLAAHPHPLPIGAALRWAQPTADQTGSASVPHSASEWVALWMMRLAGLIRIKKRTVWITEVGLEVHRRITTPPSPPAEKKGKSIYDSLFVPLPIDNSGSSHRLRVREALRRNQLKFIERNSAAVLSGIGELRKPTQMTDRPTQSLNTQLMKTTPMKKRNIMMTAADHEELSYAIAAAGKLSERGRAEMTALKRELARTKIVDANDLPPDVITMNSRAELLDLESGEQMEFTLVFPSDANIEAGKISVLAPLGTAMLGYRVGDEFAWIVPYGVRRLKVTAVHFQPEAALAIAA